MKVNNYKHLLDEMSKSKKVILTISLMTDRSKRMKYKVPYEQLKHRLDENMGIKNVRSNLKFITTNNKEYKFKIGKLRSAEVDNVEII